MDLSERALWQAVLDRNRRYNGICFYGVMSTFIYCRFHCPSKNPYLKIQGFSFPGKARKKPDSGPACVAAQTKQRSQALMKRRPRYLRCSTILNPVII